MSETYEPTSSLRFTTETGSIYEFDQQNSSIVRMAGDDSTDLRRDGEPVEVLGFPYPPVIGDPFTMCLNLRNDGVVTVRITTPITSIQYMDSVEGEAREEDDHDDGS